MVVEINLPNSINDRDIHYLPHGATTLAIEIKNTDNRDHRLIARPTNRSMPPDYVAYETLKNGKDIGSQDLKIIWGGGMTKGFEIDLQSNKKTNVFYLVIHDSEDDGGAGDAAEYSFNLEMIEVKDNSKEKVITTKLVNMKPSTQLSNSIKLKINYNGVYSRSAEFNGKLIPDYQSRWFGKENYTFRDNKLPEFILRYKEDTEKYITSEINIGIKTPNGIEDIGKIAGDVERSKLHADLFDFTDEYCVLRIWLYWTNDFFSKNRLIGGSNYMTRGSTELRSWKQRIIEVPDVERFDLVIDKKIKKIDYVGTDLHWRETWWSVNEDFANLRFAEMELVPILIKNLPQILRPYIERYFQKMIKNLPQILRPYIERYFQNTNLKGYNPADALMKTLKSKQKPIGEPTLSVRENTELINASGDTVLGHGLHRKHVPYLLGFNLMPLFVSDVLTEL